MQETSKENGRTPILEEHRGDAFANECRMQQSRGVQSITLHTLMKIDYPRLRVKGAQKQHVHKRS